MDDQPPFRIFFVCTGNQARSPFAAAWTERALSPLRVVVGSAGTLPGGPRPALPEARAIAAQMGLDLSRHTSTHVGAYDLSIADLVIGFELQHVAAAVVDAGADPRRTFLLKELNRLGDGISLPSVDAFALARETIRRADERREATGFVPGLNLADPVGRRSADVHAILLEVAEACGQMTRLLFGR